MDLEYTPSALEDHGLRVSQLREGVASSMRRVALMRAMNSSPLTATIRRKSSCLGQSNASPRNPIANVDVKLTLELPQYINTLRVKDFSYNLTSYSLTVGSMLFVLIPLMKTFSYAYFKEYVAAYTHSR